MKHNILWPTESQTQYFVQIVQSSTTYVRSFSTGYQLDTHCVSTGIPQNIRVEDLSLQSSFSAVFRQLLHSFLCVGGGQIRPKFSAAFKRAVENFFSGRARRKVSVGVPEKVAAEKWPVAVATAPRERPLNVRPRNAQGQLRSSRRADIAQRFGRIFDR